MMSKSEQQVINEAAQLLAQRDMLTQQLRALDATISNCCREYGDVMRVWGVSPEHLRRAVNARQTVTHSHSGGGQ